MDIVGAERRVHARRELAFAAAQAAGLPGLFRTLALHGLLVSLTTSPGLEFLNQVSGLTEDSVAALPEVLSMFEATTAAPPSVVAGANQPAVSEALERIGLERSDPRPIAIAVWADTLDPSAAPSALEVIEAVTPDDLRVFLRVLLGGYTASPALRGFLRAEHSSTDLRRFVVRSADGPVAAAAMSVHDGAALLGGASTLPSARGRGAQTTLLRHRLIQASVAGATMAVATAGPDSVSARNLVRAGFTLTIRQTWVPKSRS